MEALTRTGGYSTALREALKELDECYRKLEAEKNRVRDNEKRISKLFTTIDALRELVSKNESREAEINLKKLGFTSNIKPETGSASYRKILNIISRNPNKYWRAEEMQRQLHSLGIDRGPKFVYNTFQRLWEKGLLIKVRRGVYKVNDTYLGIICEEDFEDGE